MGCDRTASGTALDTMSLTDRPRRPGERGGAAAMGGDGSWGATAGTDMAGAAGTAAGSSSSSADTRRCGGTGADNAQEDIHRECSKRKYRRRAGGEPCEAWRRAGAQGDLNGAWRQLTNPQKKACWGDGHTFNFFFPSPLCSGACVHSQCTPQSGSYPQ